MTDVDPKLIERAAYRWCGKKERETFLDDILYFRNNWKTLPGLKRYVDEEIAALNQEPHHD